MISEYDRINAETILKRMDATEADMLTNLELAYRVGKDFADLCRKMLHDSTTIRININLFLVTGDTKYLRIIMGVQDEMVKVSQRMSVMAKERKAQLNS